MRRAKSSLTEIGRAFGVKNEKYRALPLRRPGQQPGPDRSATGEQHPADPARGAWRDTEPRRPARAHCKAPAWNEAMFVAPPWTSSGACASSRSRRRDRPAEYDDLFDGSPVIEAKVNADRGGHRARPSWHGRGPGDRDRATEDRAGA